MQKSTLKNYKPHLITMSNSQIIFIIKNKTIKAYNNATLNKNVKWTTKEEYLEYWSWK